MKRVGLIVNPIAGMGGRVGLKGTDGPDAVERARALGATPLSGERAAAALAVLRERLGDDLTIVTPSGPMGGDIAGALGMAIVIPSTVEGSLVRGQHGSLQDAAQSSTRDSSTSVGMTEVAAGMAVDEALTPYPSPDRGRGEITTADDTQRAARAIVESGVDLLLFAGGDGTARDVFEAVGNGPPVLGIPTGVKMHSAVYATTPRAAGEAAAGFLAAPNPSLRESEVMDIDEEAFRNGRVSARLFGYLNVPHQRSLMQGLKSGSSAGGDADFGGIAADIVERMADGALWILGPGTTTRAIAQRLGVNKTLLGVDLVSRGEIVATDVTEQAMLKHLDGVPARIVVTPIGGQGYLFGRGNQQISPEVIRRVGRQNIIVVATTAKLTGLAGEPLRVDTGDADLDAEFSGYIRVVTGYRQESVQRVA